MEGFPNQIQQPHGRIWFAHLQTKKRDSKRIITFQDRAHQVLLVLD